MKVPMYTADLLVQLKDMYKDRYESDERIVGTPEYWKKCGIIDLIRLIEISSKNNIVKEI